MLKKFFENVKNPKNNFGGRYHGPKVEGATEVNSNLEDYFIVEIDSLDNLVSSIKNLHSVPSLISIFS